MSSAGRILIAKVGLDGHDRALRLLAYELRERGAEVVILGVGTTPEQIAAVALEEDVAVIGLSIHSGAHLALIPRLLDSLEAIEADVPVVCGGVIPAGDGERLLAAGVADVAPVGTSIIQAVDLIVARASPKTTKATTR
jgi:methylmalonyl-CoA mutase C-terminal domain/subunit